MNPDTVTTFSVEEFTERMERINDDLDPVNAKILRLIGQLGPRNLLDVAREARLPPSTVYNRVNLLEKKYVPLSYANPAVSKLGLARILVFAQAKPAMESAAASALMIPGYWRTVANAEGAFTHYSIHAIPHNHLSKFRKYLSQLVKDEVLSGFRALLTSDVRMNFPNFDYFDAKRRVWTFNWKLWLRKAERGSGKRLIDEPRGYAVQADKTDLVILKELEKDGRRKFARIAKVVGVTLQAIKFRYDRRVVPRGLVQDYGYNFLPFPSEVSDVREVKLDFRSLNALNVFFAATQGLPFIVSFAKVLGQNSLILRTYLPNIEFSTLLSFVSSLAVTGIVTSYSSVRIHLHRMRSQTIPYDLFTNETGWQYDLKAHAKLLRMSIASAPKPLAR